MSLRQFTLLLSVVIVCGQNLYGQKPTAEVTGRVLDLLSNEAIELVLIYEQSQQNVTETDAAGSYSLIVPAEKSLTIEFSRVGYKPTSVDVEPLEAGITQRIDVKLVPTSSDLKVIVRQKKLTESGMIYEEGKSVEYLPSTTGNIESVLPSIALGTSSGTGGELSSQYNVRGGNYDENLVYLNGFKVYRPQLIRQGQQEGLSLPNPDLISSLSFSAGGFEPRYGDKMSSVLDIQYKRPDSLRGSVDASLLGGSVHLEGSVKKKENEDQQFNYLIGARYKTTSYLLNTLDIKGEYLPSFVDLQTYLTYDINSEWRAALLLNYNKSHYQFEPVAQETTFGLISYALRLTADFEGQEVDDFTSRLGGLSFTYLPERENNPYFLKFYTAYQDSDERVTYDILGSYRLSEIDVTPGADSQGEEVAVLGQGVQHQYARNFLNFATATVGHKGGYEFSSDSETDPTHYIQWGASVEYQAFNDRLNEWERLDSALYSLPYNEDALFLNEVNKGVNSPRTTLFNAYVQDKWNKLTQMTEMQIIGGVRANYRSLNNEWLISPRAQIKVKPRRWQKDMSFKFSTGIYAQPPFYREMRKPDGTLNTDLKAQKSAHFVLGWTYDFSLGESYPKMFRLIAEAYYKRLWDLVSYDINNVRIRYSGENDAVGNVMGLDLRLNGEFVPGAESWINLSFLRARESIVGVQHKKREVGEKEGVNVNSVPRPTDRFMNLSMYLQDYIPGNKNLQAHLQFTLGTGVPFGLEGSNKVYRNTYRFSLYHRLDVGFSYLLWEEDMREKKPLHPLRFSRKFWVSLEVFNLMGKRNVASHNWIKTVFKRYYAVPNYLTSRRFNFRVIMEF